MKSIKPNAIDSILDRVTATGQPQYINHNGKILKIGIEDMPNLFDLLQDHDIVNCNSEELVNSQTITETEWEEWKKI